MVTKKITIAALIISSVLGGFLLATNYLKFAGKSLSPLTNNEIADKINKFDGESSGKIISREKEYYPTGYKINISSDNGNHYQINSKNEIESALYNIELNTEVGLTLNEAYKKAVDYAKSKCPYYSKFNKLAYKRLGDHGSYKTYEFSWRQEIRGVKANYIYIALRSSDGELREIDFSYIPVTIDLNPKISSNEAISIAKKETIKGSKLKSISKKIYYFNKKQTLCYDLALEYKKFTGPWQGVGKERFRPVDRRLFWFTIDANTGKIVHSDRSK